jgi:hypothetical protein
VSPAGRPSAQAILDALACGGSGCPCGRAAERGEGATHCPAHPDSRPSLTVSERDGKVLVRCQTGCMQPAVIDALRARGVWPKPPKEARPVRVSPRPDQKAPPAKGEGGLSIPPKTPATVQPRSGCTLQQYAEAKGLRVEYLRELGVSDFFYLGQPAVRIPYRDPAGAEVAVHFRLALAKTPGADNRFAFKRGSKPTLYGLWRLDEIRRAGRVTIVEGPSDCHTLWQGGFLALGIPGAGNWQEAWAAHLDGIERIDVVIEPDQGGAAVREWIAKSRIRDRVRLVDLGAYKDPSGLYLDDPAQFSTRWAAALERAVPWTAEERAAEEATAEAARQGSAAVAGHPDILAHFAAALAARGVAGEERAVKLLYLIITSRLLARPVSAAVKGPSSSGKSYLTSQVLAFFPPSACYALSAMSERALAYGDEPLRHRMLLIYEAAGLAGDFASYLVRSLLSEGCVRYETVEKTADGIRPRLIEREGPTGLLVTTTRVGLHPENETRLLSIPVADTREQTRAILLALAEDEPPATSSLEAWHALQTWLEHAEHRVVIPYQKALATEIPPVAVRLRRDFGAVLNLIRAHAVLHQATRQRDAEGRVIATVDDYAAVRALVADLVAEGV